MPQNIWQMVVTFRITALSNQLAHIVDIITYIICWGKSGKKVKHTEQRSHAEKFRHCMELFDDTLWGNSNSNRLSFALLCASIRGTRSSPWRVTLSALSPVDLMTAEPRVSMQQWTLCFFFSFLLAFHCIYIYIMVMALFLCFNCIVLCFPSPLISLNPRRACAARVTVLGLWACVCAVKHARTEESAVAEHVWVSKHQVDFQGATVLEEEANLHQWLVPHQETLHF